MYLKSRLLISILQKITFNSKEYTIHFIATWIKLQWVWSNKYELVHDPGILTDLYHIEMVADETLITPFLFLHLLIRE